MSFQFRAKCINDLRIPEACAGRVRREAKFIVAVETVNGTWFELDADDSDHAQRLADNMVDNGNARGCSCWKVENDGKFSRHSFYQVYEHFNMDYHDLGV
jgi:hypothetical protein